MKTFCLMLSFFTRLPIPAPEYSQERYVKGLKFIPFVGIIMGFLLYALSFFRLIFAPPVAAMILLGGYLYMTGGLHLDGLADTCDGIFSGRERERMLEIMKDSRVGSFGVLAMLFFFTFYMVMFQYIPRESLLLLPVVGKSASLISAFIGDYARPEGMGKLIVSYTGKRELLIAVFLPCLMAIMIPLLFCYVDAGEQRVGDLYFITLILQIIAYFLAVFFSFIAVIVATRACQRKLGGITGDTMGMVCELSQMVFTFILYFFTAVPFS